MEQKHCNNCGKSVLEGKYCPHCGCELGKTKNTYPLSMGTVIQNRYLVGRQVYGDNVEVVYMGYDLEMKRLVTLHGFYPISSPDAYMMIHHTYERMFLEHLENVKKWNPLPGILTQDWSVWDVEGFHINEISFSVTVHQQAITLHTLVKELGPIDGKWLLQILRPVMIELLKVHDTGAIHGNLSPENIVLFPGGIMMVMHFADRCHHENQDTEKYGISPRKRPFAAPEQFLRKGKLGPWTDVYAFCAILYYCLTGTEPEEVPVWLTYGRQLDWSRAAGLTEYQLQVLNQGLILRGEERVQSFRELEVKLFCAYQS